MILSLKNPYNHHSPSNLCELIYFLHNAMDNLLKMKLTIDINGNGGWYWYGEIRVCRLARVGHEQVTPVEFGQSQLVPHVALARLGRSLVHHDGFSPPGHSRVRNTCNNNTGYVYFFIPFYYFSYSKIHPKLYLRCRPEPYAKTNLNITDNTS